MTRLLCILTAALLLTACGKSPEFEVEGRLPACADMPLTMVYAQPGRGLMRTPVTVDADGHFTTRGASPTPVVVDLLDAEGNLLTSFTAADGDRIRLTDDAVTGNTANEGLTLFRRDNAALLAAGNADSINGAVERWVATHAADASAAPVLMFYYDLRRDPAALARRADSLFNSIDIAARPLTLVENYAALLSAALNRQDERVRALTLVGTNDSTLSYVPSGATRTLLVLTPPTRPDSMLQLLGRARQRPEKRLKVLEINVAVDTATWHASLRGDTATWQRAWMPGGVMTPTLRRFAPQALPWYVVLDSLGYTLYRGTSATQAATYLP